MIRTSINHNKPIIQDLFTNRKYKIPKYQRAFAWKEENADKFWSDIFDSENNEDYFLGSILLSSSDNDMLEVIDGQQRLTTCSLFFLALYLVYKENVSSELASRYIYVYLKNGDIHGQFNLLTLSKNNNSFYEQLIVSSSYTDLLRLSPPDKSNKQLKDIVIFFCNKLRSNKSENIDLEKVRLNNILEIFTKKVFFLEIIVPDSSQASKLFEVLNNRGSDLTEADLIRNYLLSDLESKGLYSQEILKKWETIEESIELDNLEQFLRYASFLFSKKNDLYERVRLYNEQTSPKSLIELLFALSKHYSKFLEPDLVDDDDEESKLLMELKLLDVTQARSVLLAAYQRWSKDDCKELIRYIISFTVRYSILGKNPNKLEKKYAELSFKIYNENLTIDSIKGDIGLLVNNKDEFQISFISHEYKTTKLPRYILAKIEDHISTGEKDIVSSNIHLEHIMPKNISKWKDENPEIIPTHKIYLNTIGNMVIVHGPINTRIKNSIFSSKKEHYNDSEIKLLTDIKDHEEWGKEEIEWNAGRYLEYFNQIWTL